MRVERGTEGQGPRSIALAMTALVGASLLACAGDGKADATDGSSSDGSPSDGSLSDAFSSTTQAPSDAVAFCGALQRAVVDHLVACQGGVRAPLEAEFGQSSLCDGAGHAVMTGSATYDQQQAVACLDWLKALPCGRSLTFPHSAGPCDHALAGTLAAGQTCWLLDATLQLSECGPLAYCDVQLACPGVCRPTHGIGERCGDAIPCQRGSFCAGSSPSEPATCRPLAGAGQPCLTDIEGNPLAIDPSTNHVCVDGYHCDETRATCLPDSSIDPCTRFETTCADGLCRLQPVSSDDASSAGKWMCVPYPQPGEPCANPDPVLGGGTCAAGAYCLDGACVAFGLPGQSCQLFCAGATSCGNDHLCQPAPTRYTGACLFDLPCGQSGQACCAPCAGCGTSLQCAAGLACDLPTLTCLPAG